MESRQAHSDDPGPREPGGLRGRPGPVSTDEPPYQGDTPVTADEMDRLMSYARWARREVTLLRERLAADEARANEITSKNDAQAWVIQGYEARELLRKNSIQTYELGADIRVARASESLHGYVFTARICKIKIDHAGVSYQIDWWYQGERRAAWVRHGEVEPVDDDVLPCPGRP